MPGLRARSDLEKKINDISASLDADLKDPFVIFNQITSRKFDRNLNALKNSNDIFEYIKGEKKILEQVSGYSEWIDIERSVWSILRLR